MNSSSESSNKSLSFEDEHLNDSDDLELFTQNTCSKSNLILNPFINIPVNKIKNLQNYYTNGICNLKFNAKLKRGYIFGELGLLHRKARETTIICNEDSEFAMITKNDFYDILDMAKDQIKQKKIRFFALSIFSGFEKEIINDLFCLFSQTKLLKNDKIFIQGDEVDNIYLIKKGEIELISKNPIFEDLQEKQVFLSKSNRAKKAQNSLFPLSARNILVSPHFFLALMQLI